MANAHIAACCVLPLLGLAACSSLSGPAASADDTRAFGANRSSSSLIARAAPPLNEPNAQENQAMHRELIRSMLQQGQYYAALAHIEDQKRISGDSLELRALEAEAKRNLNRTAEAIKLYNSLLNTAFDGEAHHGLGLITFNADRVGAVQHLRMAVQKEPTDAQFRNDLGFALMQSGRYSEALTELATAVELEPGNAKARNNLIVLLIVSGDTVRARQVARDSGMNDEAYAAAQKRAESFAQSMARSGQKR